MKLNVTQAGLSDTVGLIAYWKLWAGPSGANKVFDYSLNGNEGTWQGTDLITNGDFSDFTSNPTPPTASPEDWGRTPAIDTGSRIITNATNAVRIQSGSLENASINQTPLEIGKTYVLTYDLTIASGTASMNLGGNSFSGVSAGVGKTIMATAISNLVSLESGFTATSDITFTNVFVREILQGSYPGVLFDGAGELIACGDMDTAMAVSTLTVSIWAKPDAIGGTRVLMGNTEAGNAMFEYHIDNEGKVNVNAYTSSWSQHISTTAIKAAVWTHILITYDGTDFKWYLNGSLDKTEAHIAGGAISRENAQQDMTIGAISSDSNNFAGLLDDVRIYNVVKSAAEAKSIYEVTRSRYGV